MSASTQTPRRIIIEAIDREGFREEDVDLVSGAGGFTESAFERLNAWGDETFNKATIAWEEAVENPAIEEVMPPDPRLDRCRDRASSAVDLGGLRLAADPWFT